MVNIYILKRSPLDVFVVFFRSAEAIMNKEKNEIMLLLKRDKYDKIDLPVFLHAYVRCRDQIWKSENKLDEDHEYQTWGWKKFSSLENVFTNLLDKTDNSITFDFVVCILFNLYTALDCLVNPL